ncbi:MAG: class I SAM-dependent methyltransferase [Synergistales bacterium]|nr:class I SAM-dependent methyltransferase [Synergistales bacterium]
MSLLVAAKDEEENPIDRESLFLIHSGLSQEAPGSERSTLRALAFACPLEEEPWVLDVGCGPGRQTLTLLRSLKGRVFALDAHRPYLDRLAQSAFDEGLAHRLTVVEGDMACMPFPEESFDLIWSEGAIYLVGFLRGLGLWRPLLKRGGVVAVTDAVYLTETPCAEIHAFWEEAYPLMGTVSENLAGAEEMGYEPLGHFILPREDWLGYYKLLEARLDLLAEEYKGEASLEALIEIERQEISLWKRHGDQYGYAFFVFRKGPSAVLRKEVTSR